MSKENVMKILREYPSFSKVELYNIFPDINHSVLGRYYNSFKWRVKLLEETREILMFHVEEEIQRFKYFKDIVEDYAEKNNINLIWKGTFPLLKESEQKGLYRAIRHKSFFSNEDPLNPYFYKEAYGLYIQKYNAKDVSFVVSAFSCCVSGEEFKILKRESMTAKTIPINPLKTRDWHLDCLYEVIETLFPML